MDIVAHRRIVWWLGCLVLVVLSAGCAKADLSEQPGEIIGGDDAGPSEDDVNGIDDAGETDVDAGPTETDTDVDEGCNDHDDCDAAEVCVRPDPGSEGECRVIDDGGVEGDSCEDSEDCATGLCVDGQCRASCEDVGDCLDGWSCSDQGLCEAPSCAHDGNCAAGQWCAVWANEDAGALETLCLPDNGGVEGGESCTDHDECLGRYCLEGACSAPCQNRDQCSGIDMCESLTVEKEGLEGTFDLCQQPAFIECEGPDDCAFSDLTCNMPTYDGDSIDGASCGPINPGQADLGAVCGGDSECHSNLCLPHDGGAIGECSVFCQSTSAHCGTGQVCLGITDDIGLCISSCDRNADCFGDDVCRFGLETSGELTQFCDAPVGDRELGAECDLDTQCRSGLCLGSFSEQSCSSDANCPGELRCGPCPSGLPWCSPGQNVCQLSNCSAVCAAHGDCSGDHGMTECADDIVMTIDGGQQTTVSACAWP